MKKLVSILFDRWLVTSASASANFRMQLSLQTDEMHDTEGVICKNPRRLCGLYSAVKCRVIYRELILVNPHCGELSINEARGGLCFSWRTKKHSCCASVIVSIKRSHTAEADRLRGSVKLQPFGAIGLRKADVSVIKSTSCGREESVMSITMEQSRLEAVGVQWQSPVDISQLHSENKRRKNTVNRCWFG